MTAIVVEPSNDLVKIVEESGLESQTALNIKEKFLPFFEKAEEWKRKAEALVVTDASQKHEMAMARAARLAIREIRIEADKTRKALKEDSLRYGKAVQGVYNVIEYLIAPIEKHLEEQEKFAEIQEAKRKAFLKAERETEIIPFAGFIPYGLDFGAMPEDDYQKLLNGAKLQLEAQIDAERKAEEERIAREKAEAEERERIRLENEQLRKEAQEREESAQKEREESERALAAERAKAEAQRIELEEKARSEREAAEAERERVANEQHLKLEAERIQREKAEAELREKAAAEAKEQARIAAERKAQEAAEKKAKAAPDKAKLIEFAKSLDTLTLPELKTEEGQAILSDVKGLLAKVSKFIRVKSEGL